MTTRLTWLNVRAAVVSRELKQFFGVPFWVQTCQIKGQVINSNKACEIIYDSKSNRTITLAENQKLQSIISHFQAGIPWEVTPLYQIMMNRIIEAGGTYKGLRSISDIRNYYIQMDEYFEEVGKRGLWIPESKPFLGLLDRNFPLNGVTIQVLDNGQPYFAGRGTHRLAMSFAAGRELTPVYLTGISKQSLKDGSWSRYLTSATREDI